MASKGIVARKVIKVFSKYKSNTRPIVGGNCPISFAYHGDTPHPMMSGFRKCPRLAEMYDEVSWMQWNHLTAGKIVNIAKQYLKTIKE